MIPPESRLFLWRISGSLRLTIATDLKRLVLNVEDLAELLNQDGLTSHRAGLAECAEHIRAARAAYDAAMVEHAKEIGARFADGLPVHEKESTL